MSEIKSIRQKAVAVKYDGQTAPKVVAKGEGDIADKIIEIAKEHGVVLYQDSELVKLLSRVELNEEIPNNLYHAVAAVLAFVYKLNGKAGEYSKEQVNPAQAEPPFGNSN